MNRFRNSLILIIGLAILLSSCLPITPIPGSSSEAMIQTAIASTQKAEQAKQAAASLYGTGTPDSDTEIDASLVSAGLSITDFFNTKEGTRGLLVTNASAITSDTITIKSGSGTASGLGDLDVDIAENEQYLIGNLDSARFDQGDGSLYVDFYTSVTGYIVGFGEKRALT